MCVVMGMLCVGYHFGFCNFEFIFIYGELALTCIDPALTLSAHSRCVHCTPDRNTGQNGGDGKNVNREPLTQLTAFQGARDILTQVSSTQCSIVTGQTREILIKDEVGLLL